MKYRTPDKLGQIYLWRKVQLSLTALDKYPHNLVGKRTTTLLRNVPDATRFYDCQYHDDGIRQDRGNPRAEEN